MIPQRPQELEEGARIDLIGAGDRIRTCDRRITNPLLYRLSYASFS